MLPKQDTEPVNEGVKEPVNEGVKEPVNKGVKEPVNKGVNIPSRVGSKQTLGQTEESEVAAPAPSNSRWGWVVLICGFINMGITDGVAFSFGTMIDAIAHELQEPHSLVALINSVSVGLYFMLSPLAAALINKFGFRYVGMSGAIICSFGMFASYFAAGFDALIIFQGCVLGLGASLLALSSTLVVGFYFDKLRNLALSVVTAGASFGVMAMYPMNAALVSLGGWRKTVLLESGIFGLAYFSSLTFRSLESQTMAKSDGQPKVTISLVASSLGIPQGSSGGPSTSGGDGRVPKDEWTGPEHQLTGSRAGTADEPDEPHQRAGLFSSVRRILASMFDVSLMRRLSFMLFCLSGFLVFTGLLVPYVYLQDRNLKAGVDPVHCSYFISVLSASNAFGRFLLGYLAVKFDPNLLFTLGLIVAGISTSLSGLSYSLFYQYAYSVVFGFAIAAVNSLRSVVIVSLYGLESLTNASGVILLFKGIGNIISTPLAGVLESSFGYDVSFYVAGAFIVAGGIASIPIKRFAKKENRQREIAEQIRSANIPGTSLAK